MIDELLRKYAKICIDKDLTYTDTAKLIKDTEDIDLSVRTLRGKLSQFLKENETAVPADVTEVTSITESDKSKTYEFKGRKSITSKQEAIEFFNINTDEERIVKCKYNSWDVTNSSGITYTNYQVKVETACVEKPFDYKRAFSVLDKHLEKIGTYSNYEVAGNGNIVVGISDIHVGAKTDASKGIINSRDYNYDIMVNYLNDVVHKINSLEKKAVTVALAGDFVEAISGLNHLSSWHEMEENYYGGNAIIAAHKTLATFLSSINNLDKVYMVSGNHDRLSANKDVDTKGDVGLLLSYMLERDFDVEYHPMICNFVVDDISYILSHGNYRITSKPLTQIILNYGRQDLYNVCVSGHFHSRKTTKDIQRQDYILDDSANYRGIVLPPIFTGNFYAENSGWTSSPGFAVMEANKKKNNINYFDYGL